MVKKKKMKTFLAASLSTVVLASSYYNVKADDKTTLEKTIANAAVVDRLSESDEKKVTLITGDVVKVKKIENGKSVIDVEPADQNAAGVQVLTIGEDTYVIPKSAMPYLAADKLDKDLFNVTKLLENGYDDKSLSSLPVIVEYTESTAGVVQTEGSFQTTGADQKKKANPKGAKRVRDLESINGAALETSKKEADTFWKDITPEASQKAKPKFDQGIEKIWLDGRVEATLDKSVPQIGAPTAWESGFTGKGVKVAVLDTGIDPNHPDLANQLDEAKSFVPGETVDDVDGHGTHVASTVLGTGAASEGKNKGVAPEARLLVGKVLDNNGDGFDSWIIDGMEWAAHKAKIVSMSLGGGASDGTDPLSQAVNRLSEETGALFVIAAGNTGAEGTIASPGAADAALTIGAVDKADKIAYFSSKGPRVDMGLKPDLSAPGVGIVAAKSGLLPGSGSYMSLSGTSMATPHVAGAAAILLQKHPEWNGTQLKEALMSTSKRLDYSPYHIGSGRLDVQAAVFSRVRATGSLSYVFKWPNNNAQPVQKTVTYTNDSDSAVTLNLQADFKNADGKNAPEGMLTVSENQITVPANGTKTVTVTVDPKLGNLGTRYEGQLTATDSEGKQVAHTSIGMMKEKERYPLTFKATDRNGNPTNTGYLFILSEDGQFQFVYGDGTTEILLPPGTYSAMSYMEVDDETDHSGVALVGNPEIKLDGPQTVELDARKAKEITVDTPKKAEPSFQEMVYNRPFVDGKPAWVAFLLYPWTDKMYAVPTKEVTTGEFEYSTRWRLIKPSLEINFKGKVLDDIPLPGSTLLDGKYNLSTVYAGKGTPADYERLKANGKAVVVDRNTEVTPSEQATAAHAAGAKLLIIVNNEDKEFYWYVGNTTDWTDIPLAVAGISKSEGDEVIAAARSGNLNLFVEGESNPSYLYDLMDVHQDQIPNNLKYAPSNSELVKIDTRYKSDREAPGEEFRYDFRPNRLMGFSSRYLQKLPLPTVRTEWVSVDKDTSWSHQASVVDSSWEVRQPLVTYKKGQRLQEEWFSPVVRPRLGKGYEPRRLEDDLGFYIPAWADSGNGSTGHVNNAESVKNQTLKLYQGDTLLQEEKGQILISNKPVPEEKTQYRLVSDAKRDPNRWKTSLSTHTEWAFWSQKGEESQTLLPFYSLDYKVDTDMNGNAPAERPAKLELSVAKLEGVAGYGKLEGATLEVSFNEGESWETVNLQRSADNKWEAKINNPKNATYVSLRANAWDDQGNKISQDIIKAYGLK
ncbi:S8 family peptidase [Peribacillus alkalitolerans]|uniref:S8 family peptidase n=1 Tax=Peribacillus alkalitolerans TaxID=1550385 RepID=UPI0013D479DA|nr:S8 family serine peptidase [Peribacillus alkalitolerans]